MWTPESGPGPSILPIYLVCDLSSSMAHGGRIEALRDAISALRDAVWVNPVVSDCARIAVIGFSSRARLLLPLCDIALVDELPALRPDGLTSYQSVFELLRETITSDIAQLRGDDLRVWRPMVFFVSDGEPTDRTRQWRAAHQRLVDRSYDGSPDIIAFAVGEASASTMAGVATSRCFVAHGGTAVRDAIAGIGDLVVRSVVASSTSGVPLVAQTLPDGFHELDLV